MDIAEEFHLTFKADRLLWSRVWEQLLLFIVIYFYKLYLSLFMFFLYHAVFKQWTHTVSWRAIINAAYGCLYTRKYVLMTIKNPLKYLMCRTNMNSEIIPHPKCSQEELFWNTTVFFFVFQYAWGWILPRTTNRSVKYSL